MTDTCSEGDLPVRQTDTEARSPAAAVNMKRLALDADADADTAADADADAATHLQQKGILPVRRSRFNNAPHLSVVRVRRNGKVHVLHI